MHVLLRFMYHWPKIDNDNRTVGVAVSDSVYVFVMFHCNASIDIIWEFGTIFYRFCVLYTFFLQGEAVALVLVKFTVVFVMVENSYFYHIEEMSSRIQI